jgi:putative transposase
MRRERKIIRLRTFDYRYECSHYLTICTKDRGYFLGNIKDKKIEYSPVGEIAKLFWTDIPNHFPHVVLDEFIIMPNHIHGIIKLDYSLIGTCNGETSTGTCHGEKSIQ